MFVWEILYRKRARQRERVCMGCREICLQGISEGHAWDNVGNLYFTWIQYHLYDIPCIYYYGVRGWMDGGSFVCDNTSRFGNKTAFAERAVIMELYGWMEWGAIMIHYAMLYYAVHIYTI